MKLGTFAIASRARSAALLTAALRSGAGATGAFVSGAALTGEAWTGSDWTGAGGGADIGSILAVPDRPSGRTAGGSADCVPRWIA